MLSTICSTDINNQQLYNVHQIATLLQPQNINYDTKSQHTVLSIVQSLVTQRPTLAKLGREVT